MKCKLLGTTAPNWGYIVNAIIDASYKAAESKKWEPVELKDWRSGPVNQETLV